MSPKKKRSKQAPRSEAKKTPEAPFFRPFSELSDKVAKKTAGTQPTKTGTQPTKTAGTQPKAPVRVQPKRTAPTREQTSDDPDDLLTFERLMSGVQPLEDAGARRVSTSQDDVDSRLTKQSRAQRALEHETSEREALAKLHALVEEGSRFEVQDDGRRIEGRRRGVDGGLVRRMRHGEIPVDATLDLHGMRVDEARKAVEAFVRDRRTKGDRMVVLVHGRGRNSPGQQPVLRGEVAAWLSDGPASKHVSAFLTSPPEHGGEGALSVLLAQASDSHRGMR